jgi:hypothetical protein
MKKLLRTTLVIGGLLALACGGEEPEPSEPPPPPPPVDPEPEPAATIEPGDIPFDFPRMSAQGRDGQFALVPSREFLDRAISDNGEGTFIYYGATIVTAASPESTIQSLAGTTFSMPNSLVIPIRAGQKAKKGDILLGHWESGSGLQRAIVVGGTETEPVVRYLDMDLDNPSGWGEKEDTWKADRFSVISEPWQVGTTAACGESNDRKHGIITAVSGNRVLVSGFAGALSAHSRSECVSLTPAPTLTAGDTVWVPAVGSYVQGTVSRIEADIGRVFVSYEWGGQQKEGGFAILDVAPDFTQPAPPVVATPEPTEPGEEQHPGLGRTPRIPKGTKATGPRGRGKIGKVGKNGSGESGSGESGSGSGGGGR